MAMMWLPFYNLGGVVGPNQSNNSLDVKLFWYLPCKVVGGVAGTMGGPPPPVAVSSRLGQHKYQGRRGSSGSVPSR